MILSQREDIIVLGKTNASCGNSIRIAKNTSRLIRKGDIPLKTSYIGTFAMPLTIKTVTPMGGVIRPISHMTVRTTPNHIGSYPSARITGTKMGMVSNIMAIVSIKQPRIK